MLKILVKTYPAVALLLFSVLLVGAWAIVEHRRSIERDDEVKEAIEAIVEEIKRHHLHELGDLDVNCAIWRESITTALVQRLQ